MMMCGVRLCVVCVCVGYCVCLCGLVAIHRARLYALFECMCVSLCLCVTVFFEEKAFVGLGCGSLCVLYV